MPVRLRYVVPLVLVLLVLPVVAHPATYTVSPSGNDGAGCGGVMRTIGQARTCLRPGDTLLLRGGTYQESLIDGAFPGGTSWETAVTIKGAPGETVIWQAQPSCRYPDDCRFPVYLRSASERYIIFDSLIFDGNNQTTNAPMINGASADAASQPSHIRFANVEIRNFYSNVDVFAAVDVQFINGSIHDNCCDYFIPPQPQLFHPPGIYVNGVTGLLLDNVAVYNHRGYGLQVYGGGTSTKQSTGIVIRNSSFSHNGLAGEECGITVADTTDMLIHNNVFVGNGVNGGCAIAVGHGACASQIRIYNNTFVGHQACDGCATVYVQCGAGHVVQNNLFWNNQGDAYAAIGGTATVDHNLLGINPLFVNEAGGNFRLADTSPAKDIGVDVGLPYAGLRPDAGAHEIGMQTGPGTVGGPLSTRPPSPLPRPKNLRAITKS